MTAGVCNAFPWTLSEYFWTGFNTREKGRCVWTFSSPDCSQDGFMFSADFFVILGDAPEFIRSIMVCDCPKGTLLLSSLIFNAMRVALNNRSIIVCSFPGYNKKVLSFSAAEETVMSDEETPLKDSDVSENEIRRRPKRQTL